MQVVKTLNLIHSDWTGNPPPFISLLPSQNDMKKGVVLEILELSVIFQTTPALGRRTGGLNLKVSFQWINLFSF